MHAMRRFLCRIEASAALGAIVVGCTACGRPVPRPLITSSETGDALGYCLAVVPDANAPGSDALAIAAVPDRIGYRAPTADSAEAVPCQVFLAYSLLFSATSCGRRIATAWANEVSIRDHDSGTVLAQMTVDAADYVQSLAFVEDRTGDGCQDLALAAQRKDGPRCVFLWDGKTEDVLTEWTNSYGDLDYGASLVTADTNSDGVSEVLIGAPPLDSAVAGPELHGVVEIRDGRSGQITHVIESPHASIAFGEAIYVIADHRGQPLIAIGAPSVADAGRVFLYAAPTYVAQAEIAADDGAMSDGFGSALASIDWDLDGFQDLVVGAPRILCHDGEGGVFVFDTESNEEIGRCMAPPAAYSFGRALAVGNVANVRALFVSAPDVNGDHKGHAQVFTLAER